MKRKDFANYLQEAGEFNEDKKRELERKDRDLCKKIEKEEMVIRTIQNTVKALNFETDILNNELLFSNLNILRLEKESLEKIINNIKNISCDDFEFRIQSNNISLKKSLYCLDFLYPNRLVKGEFEGESWVHANGFYEEEIDDLINASLKYKEALKVFEEMDIEPTNKFDSFHETQEEHGFIKDGKRIWVWKTTEGYKLYNEGEVVV